MDCNNLTSGNGTLPSKHSYTLKTSVPLTILVGILILLTVFGNVLVVIAVCTSRALRAPQNLFLVSLACADILVATLVMPFSLANELMGNWYFGRIWCEIYLALDVLFCTSSIVHLCAISLDRYWSITQPFKYNLKRTPRRIKCVVLALWMLAAIISFPPLISMEKEVARDDGPVCKINEEKWYVIFSSTASFFAPCVIMILVYTRIYQIAKKRTRALPGERQRREREQTDDRQRGSLQQDPQGREKKVGEEMEEEEDDGGGEVDGVDVEDEGSSSDENENTLCSPKRLKVKKTPKGVSQVKPGEHSPKTGGGGAVKVSRWSVRANREKRFTFVLAVVMGVFVLCWFPFFFTYTLTALCPLCCVPETLFKMFFWLGYCNSSLNPVIYTIFNNDFRRSFKKILCNRDRRGV